MTQPSGVALALAAVFVVGAGGALAGCTAADMNAGNSSTGADQGVISGGAPVVDVADPAMGDDFAKCVNGVAVAIRSLTESGGVSPDIPTTIISATTAVPPLSGGTLLALADGTTLMASDPERDQVYVIAAGMGAVRATVPLQAGDEPGRLIEDDAGRVHVVLRRGGALVTIDPGTATVTTRRSVCAAPRGVAFQNDTRELHVACAGGELVSLPADGGGPTRTVILERDLRDVVVGGDGTLLVSTFRTAEVLVVGAGGNVGARLRPGTGPAPAVARLSGTEMRTPSVAWRMVGLDAKANSVLMLHQTGITDIVDTTPGGYFGLAGCGGIVQPGLTVLAPGRPSPPVAMGLGALALAIDVAVSPDHEKVALAVAGNGRAQGPTVVEESMQLAVPAAPAACGAINNDIARPVPAGQVVAVSYAPSGVLFVQTREPAAVWRADTGAVIPLASDSRADTGHLIFHANSGAGLACASCHPEGGEDGRVWNFVCTGARRTQSVAGGISQTAPFHWDGSEADFSALVDDVFSGRMAGPLLSDQQKLALQAWVDTIPASPPPPGLDAAAVGRGKALFQDAGVGCATCHSGPLLTNNATIGVGTGAAFQVPSLRGVSARAPFMHDGCAATLVDRFTSPACGGGDKHGVTSGLGAGQLGDLVSYLQSL